MDTNSLIDGNYPIVRSESFLIAFIEPTMTSVSMKLKCLVRSLILTMLCGSAARADDVEIFFSQVSRVEAQPNIIFLIDASESMNRYDCLNGRRQTNPCNDGSPTGNVTRLQRVNEAMIEIINNASGINIGLMRFSNTQAGGRVIYPVRNVDLDLCDGTPCDPTVDFSGTRTSVRQELIDTLQNVVTQWATPTTGGMLEALHYWSGDTVEYGTTRWNPARAHRTERGQHSRVSHPDSYTGGTLIQNGDCSNADLSDPDCADESISGSPVYTSPIQNECQANHLLLVADGEAGSDAPAASSAVSIVGSCPSYRGKGECAVELADYMAETDLRPDIDGIQTVTTHTIGLNLSSNWLRDIATATRLDNGVETPGYYEVESTDQLVEAINSIFSNIEFQGTTFVSPAVTVDRFSRISHRNDLYLSLFDPADSASWPGNLKRYDLRGNPAELYDSSNPPVPAVDPDTGQFRVGTRSFWSIVADGNDVAAGGAASKITYQSRRAVTFAGTAEKRLFHADNELSADNNFLSYNEDPSITNIAPSGFASQSSISHNGSPGRAIDGNTSGVWNHGSVTHTTNETQPWWQVELPEVSNIEQIVLHNRTDNCCTARLTDVHVFVSETPFTTNDPDELQNIPNVWHRFLPGEQSPGATLNVNARGQYIRVQLNGNDSGRGTLSLAEVQIYGGNLTQERLDNIAMLEWALGKDVKDADQDGETDDTRYHMGDPLHSVPVTITYGGTAEDPDSLVFVGTNEGYLHAINSHNGTEHFSFMPEELMANIPKLFNNDQSTGKVYGMDGGLTLWTNDTDQDGHIENIYNEHAYLYAGMRRGGSSYYALDVSDRDAPVFKWQIKGGNNGTPGFGELGQTWSDMVPVTLKHGNTTKKVLIFGGGYDVSQDQKLTRMPDTVGRALYIVDADTGGLLWSGGPGDHNETKVFAQMTYSIPATPKAIDVDQDGAVEQIYVGDMGGRVWRFDIDPDSETLNIDGGIIADLGIDNVFSDARRFYHSPDISLSVEDSKHILNIAIGSGYQAHPLNKIIDDRFYLIRYPYDYRGEGKYGILPPKPIAAPDVAESYSPINESRLYDATPNLIGQGPTDQVGIERAKLAEAAGWYIEMDQTGEKVLGESETFNNKVLWTSYIPGDTSDPCSPNIGSGRFWAVNLLDGTPFDDFNDDSTLNATDRNKPIPSPGIPPAPQTLIIHTKTTDEEGNTIDGDVQVVTLSGANVLLDHDVNTLVKRVSWSEYSDI